MSQANESGLLTSSQIEQKYSLTSNSTYQDYKRAVIESDQATTNERALTTAYVGHHLSLEETIQLAAEVSLHRPKVRERVIAIQFLSRLIEEVTTVPAPLSQLVSNNVMDEVQALQPDARSRYEMIQFVESAMGILLKLHDCRALDLISCQRSRLEVLRHGETLANATPELVCEFAARQLATSPGKSHTLYFTLLCDCARAGHKTTTATVENVWNLYTSSGTN
jgi:hypothetical protein